MTGELESSEPPTEGEPSPSDDAAAATEGEALPVSDETLLLQQQDETLPTEDETEPTEDATPSGGVSMTVLVVSVLAALLVAGVAGLLLGWKIEQQRVKDDLANIRPVGTVTAVSDSSITVELQTASGTRTYEITDATVVDDGTRTGDVSDVEEGSTVLVRGRSAGDKVKAVEIVVLPDSTTFGGG